MTKIVGLSYVKRPLLFYIGKLLTNSILTLATKCQWLDALVFCVNEKTICWKLLARSCSCKEGRQMLHEADFQILKMYAFLVQVELMAQTQSHTQIFSPKMAQVCVLIIVRCKFKILRAPTNNQYVQIQTIFFFFQVFSPTSSNKFSIQAQRHPNMYMFKKCNL